WIRGVFFAVIVILDPRHIRSRQIHNEDEAQNNPCPVRLWDSSALRLWPAKHTSLDEQNHNYRDGEEESKEHHLAYAEFGHLPSKGEIVEAVRHQMAHQGIA